MAIEPDELEGLARAVAAGSAICLLGAGFATQAKQMDQKEFVPSSPQLVAILKNLIEVPEEEQLSLADIAEVAHDTPDGKNRVNIELVKRLTSTQPTEDQKFLINQNWRSIFTTNFDDVIERAIEKDFHPITPLTDVAAIQSKKTPIYYLHGRALDVRESDKDPKIVISESNYLLLGQQNRALYSRLLNEVLCAKAIIIVGYSLRDLEIARQFLVNSDDIRSKTFIVTHESDTFHTVQRLRKFGTVIPIGLSGFVERVRNINAEINNFRSYQYLREFSINYENPEDAGDLTGDDFIHSVIQGALEQDKIFQQQISDNKPYCVMREQALSTIVSGSQQRYIVSSDFGNGSCPTWWCKSRRSKVGSGSGQAATAGRLTMGLWLTEPRVSSVM